MPEEYEKIISNFRKGNRTAFKQIFDLFFSSLCLFANKYNNDSKESEDIVQEVFIIVWEKRKQFTDINYLRAFLYETVKNKSLNAIKHLKVKNRYAEIQINERETDNYYANLFQARIKEITNVKVQVPELSPHMGAVLMARNFHQNNLV